MKIKSAFILIFLLFGLGCTKTDISLEQADAFVKFFGNYLSDEAKDVKQTTDGGYIIVGSTTRPDGATDVILIKADKYGNEEWSSIYGGPGDDVGNSVQITSDGGYVVCGTYENLGNNEKDLYLIKVASNGTLMWEKISAVRVQGNQYGNCVKEISNGFVVAGTSDENGLDQVFCAEFSASGDSSRYKSDEGTGFGDQGITIVENSTYNGYIIAGSTQGNDGDLLVVAVHGFSGGWAYITLPSTGLDLAHQIEHAGGDEYIITCTLNSGVNSTIGLFKIRGISGPHVEPVWIEFVTIQEPGKRALGASVFVYENGDFGALGSSLTGPGNNDFYFVRTDGSGNALQGWTHTYGGTGHEYGLAVAPTSDGGFVMAGSTGIPEDENRMITLIKVKSNGSFN